MAVYGISLLHNVAYPFDIFCDFCCCFYGILCFYFWIFFCVILNDAGTDTGCRSVACCVLVYYSAAVAAVAFAVVADDIATFL